MRSLKNLICSERHSRMVGWLLRPYKIQHVVTLEKRHSDLKNVHTNHRKCKTKLPSVTSWLGDEQPRVEG